MSLRDPNIFTLKDTTSERQVEGSLTCAPWIPLPFSSFQPVTSSKMKARSDTKQLRFLASCREVLRAMEAFPTGNREGHRDKIPNHKVGDISSQTNNLPNTLVSKGSAIGARLFAMKRMEITSTDPSHDDFQDGIRRSFNLRKGDLSAFHSFNICEECSTTGWLVAGAGHVQ